MKPLRSLACASVMALASASIASAGSITFDDFSVDQGPHSNTGSLTSTVGNRTILLNPLGGAAPISNVVEVTSGVLDITNGTGDDSQVVVTWAINPALAIPLGSTNLRLTLVVVGSDANPTSIALSGVAGGNFNIPGNTNNQTVAFNIAGPPVGPGNLILTIDGQPGWDLTLDAIGFDWNDPSVDPIPEPTTLSLLGLGLARLAFRRRRA